MANTPFTGLEDTALLIKIKLDGTDERAYGIQMIHLRLIIPSTNIQLRTGFNWRSGN